MSEISNRPDPNAAFPNPKIPSLCYIKNVVKNPRIVVGDWDIEKIEANFEALSRSSRKEEQRENQSEDMRSHKASDFGSG